MIIYSFIFQYNQFHNSVYLGSRELAHFSVECIDSLAGMRRFRTDRSGDYDCRSGACEFQREGIGEMDGRKTDNILCFFSKNILILNCQFVILRDLEREQLVKVATARRRMVRRRGDIGRY